MRDDYAQWLSDQGYVENTRNSRLSMVRVIEQVYGALDNLTFADGLDALVRELTYSSEDERRKRANPSRIPIDGNIRNGLASYKSLRPKGDAIIISD